MKALIDISDRDLETLVFQPLKPLPKVNVENLIKILQQGVIIPENATNGDMIKAMFPNIEIEEIDDELIVAYKLDVKGTPFYRVWWNAPYKELNNEK